MASAKVNELLAQIIRGKEEQDAILEKLLQAISNQKIDDQKGQQINCQNQSDNLKQIVNDNSSLSIVAEDFTQSTADIIECPESDGQSVLEAKSPVVQESECLATNLESNSPHVQRPASMSPAVQAPESPVSSDFSPASYEQTDYDENQDKLISERSLSSELLEYSDQCTKLNSEQSFLSSLQADYRAYQAKLNAERSSEQSTFN